MEVKIGGDKFNSIFEMLMADFVGLGYDMNILKLDFAAFSKTIDTLVENGYSEEEAIRLVTENWDFASLDEIE